LIVALKDVLESLDPEVGLFNIVLQFVLKRYYIKKKKETKVLTVIT